MRSLLFLLAALPALSVAAFPPAWAQQEQPVPAPAQQQAAQLPDTTRAPGPPPDFAAPPTDRPLRGVAWRPPAEQAQAIRALRRIKKAGAEAVRTPLIRREALLDVADSLRLRLFQDLPAAYLSAGAFGAALPHLRWELERALLAARRHPSARHFGLLSHGDTSTPRTCAMLRELATRVQATGPQGATAYYSTPFAGGDRCAGAAPLTLLEVLDRDQPQLLLRRWQQGHADSSRAGNALPDSMAVGVGALGTWVDPNAEGLRAPHSPESQARYFEEHLPPLLRDSMRASSAAVTPARSADRLGPAARVVFAYRWRDAAGGPAAATDEDPYGRRYGLHDAAGPPRPALKVIRGLYTGQQAVFAFDAGRAPAERFPWLVLMGWGLVAMLGVAYAGATRFRGLVQRYFGGQGFYRDAVPEDRAALGSGSVVLLVGAALCSGLVVTVFGLAVQETGPFLQMMRNASGTTLGWATTLLERPWIAVLIVAGFYGASLAVWAVLLSVATRQALRPLSVNQALALVVWPCWPVFLLGGAAIVATTLPAAWMLPVSGGGVTLWAGAIVAGALRTLYDVARMSDFSPIAVPALAFLNPLLLAAVMAFFAVLEVLPEARFLWHLATRA